MQSHDAESQSSFGHRASEQERAFDLRDPYKLNRAPLLRGGKRRLSGLPSYAAVMISAAALVGLGVYVGRELVRPPQRPWEGAILSLNIAIVVITRFPCQRQGASADKLQVKATKMLHCFGLAQSKHNPISRRHGAWCLY